MRRDGDVVHQLVPDFVLRADIPPVLVGAFEDRIDAGADIGLVDGELLRDGNLIDALHYRVRVYLVAPIRRPCSRLNAASISWL